MALVEIDDAALRNADLFLTTFLRERIPDADFSEGGVVRDFSVKAIAYVFAFLTKERQTISDHQSLVALAALTPTESVDDAVDALLSNWFLTRNSGRAAHIPTTLHFSAQADVTIPATVKFTKSTGLTFVTGATTPTTIPASALTPVFDSDGAVVDYTTLISLTASDVGTDYNVPAGRFISADYFSPYFTYAENTSAVSDGLNVESTADLLERAPNAITVRNLINVKSVDTVLRQEFSDVSRTKSIGFGDPEMLRDFTSEGVTQLAMHVGGHTDVFVELGRTDVVEVKQLGGSLTRADGVINYLMDTSVDFVAAGVEVGDILRIVDGLPTAPGDYIIKAVTATKLTVDPRAAFAVATEETGEFVSYTIGRLAPDYSEIMGSPAAIETGATSRQVVVSGGIFLDPRPHYKIKRVEINDGFTISVLTTRINDSTLLAPGDYVITNENPGSSQSAKCVARLEVDGGTYTDGWEVRVTYETLSNYDAVQAYLVDTFQRVLNSNMLGRGHHPIYISVNVAYQPKVGATTTLDEDAVGVAVAQYINSFDTTNVIDVSSVSQFLRETYTDLGVIIGPMVLTYSLIAPDGQVLTYTTKDKVTIFPSYPDNNANLTNGASLRVPIVNADLDPAQPANTALVEAANEELRVLLVSLGVSDSVVRYLCVPEDVTVTQVI